MDKAVDEQTSAPNPQYIDTNSPQTINHTHLPGVATHSNHPIKLQPNKFKHRQMIIEKDVNFHLAAQDQVSPIIGKAYLAYFPGEFIIEHASVHALIERHACQTNRLEVLTTRISDELKATLHVEDVAVILEGKHFDGPHVTTAITTTYSGQFTNSHNIYEFKSAVQHFTT